jgi:hypothetical protein
MTQAINRKPLLELVQIYFDYLFTDLGFTVASTRDNPARDYTEVLLESLDCFIKFSWQRGEWEMQMARRTGPAGQGEWLSAGLIYNYVTNTPVNIEESLKPRPILLPEETLKQWSDKLRPVIGEAVAFFRPEGFEARLRDFRQFVNEQNAEALRQLQVIEARKRAN